MLSLFLLSCLLPQLIFGYTYPMFTTSKYKPAARYPTTAFIPVALSLPPPPGRYTALEYDDVEESEPFYSMYDPVSSDDGSLNEQQLLPNVEANSMFLQNLILAKMYQDAAARAAANDRGPPARLARELFTDERPWMYGVATTDIDDRARTQQLFREDDAEVNELEALRKKEEEEKAKKKKEREAARAARRKPKQRVVEQQQQKKSKLLATTKTPPLEANAILKNRGQEEFVLQQPAITSSRAVSSRNTDDGQPSVYQTIKQLLTMEDGPRKDLGRNLKKRFVSNTDEQLATELRDLTRRRIAI